MGEIIFESPSTRIERFQDNGVDIVRKTVKGKFARLLTSHEVNVLRRLKGVVGVQELIEQDSPTSFTSRYIEGKTLREHEGSMVPDGFFDKLENVLNEIHGRGVADPDFAHSVDIIITPTGNPVVIDLASAIIYNPDERSQILRRIVFNYIANLNKKYLLKRKARFAPHLITHQELQAIKNTGIGPKIAQYWRELGRLIKKKPYFRKD